jgi:hypothetical protein
VSKSPAWPTDLSRIASSGFRDVSRLASADPLMHRDICLTNSENILRCIDEFRAELDDLAELIRAHDPEIERAFDTAKKTRDRWVRQREEGANPKSPMAGIVNPLGPLVRGYRGWPGTDDEGKKPGRK